MLQIKDTLVSDDLLLESFVCDLAKCKGACCVAGDSGAPVDENEKAILEEIYPRVKPYMRPEGIEPVRPSAIHPAGGRKRVRLPGVRTGRRGHLRHRKSLRGRSYPVQKARLVPSVPRSAQPDHVFHRPELQPVGRLPGCLRIGPETERPGI